MRTLGIRGSCAAPSGPPPPPPMLTSAPPTSSTATSPRRRPTACGSPTSPTCPPGRGSATPRSSSTPTAAPSSAGGSPPPCGPAWPWTPWRWPSGPAKRPAWTTWCTAGQVELATLEWVQWWNTRRLHGALDHIPPAEHETLYYRQLEQSKEVG